MKHEDWNRVIGLWHSGASIDQISSQTGVPSHVLGKGLLNAAERAARVWNNCGVSKDKPVYYPEVVKR